MGVSENSVPHCTYWLMIIIPIKWLFHWEYTQHFQTNPYPNFTYGGYLGVQFHLKMPKNDHSCVVTTSGVQNATVAPGCTH